MEEKKNKVMSWIKKNSVTVGVCAISITYEILRIYGMAKLEKKCGELEKENHRLGSENLDLQGQVHAAERENRRMSRENGNLNYQLGKIVASSNK